MSELWNLLAVSGAHSTGSYCDRVNFSQSFMKLETRFTRVQLTDADDIRKFLLKEETAQIL
jgi:hypothetical protein